MSRCREGLVGTTEEEAEGKDGKQEVRDACVVNIEM